MKLKLTRVLLLLSASAITFVSISASAERMFVADKLVIDVYAEPDQESERIATLETGDTVETIEQLGNFTRVQLGDGSEGWVGANYLSLDAPAVVLLQRLEQEHKAASQKSERQFKAQLEEVQEENEALQSEIETLKAAALKAAAEAESKRQGQQASVEKVVAEPAGSERGFNIAWLWAPLVLVAGGAGYVAGYQTLARRIRNKFGGVKIYQ